MSVAIDLAAPDYALVYRDAQLIACVHIGRKRGYWGVVKLAWPTKKGQHYRLEYLYADGR